MWKFSMWKLSLYGAFIIIFDSLFPPPLTRVGEFSTLDERLYFNPQKSALSLRKVCICLGILESHFCG